MQNWGVSRRLGLVNGGFHGYINRKPGDYPHLWPKYGSTTEDVERSLRVFNEDRVLLRLKFLTVDTLCYVGAGGLQSFAGNARKARERRQIFALEKMFPEFIKTGDQIYARTVNCKFLHAGKGVRKTEGLPWLGKYFFRAFSIQTFAFQFSFLKNPCPRQRGAGAQRGQGHRCLQGRREDRGHDQGRGGQPLEFAALIFTFFSLLYLSIF